LSYSKSCKKPAAVRGAGIKLVHNCAGAQRGRPAGVWLWGRRFCVVGASRRVGRRWVRLNGERHDGELRRGFLRGFCLAGYSSDELQHSHDQRDQRYSNLWRQLALVTGRPSFFPHSSDTTNHLLALQKTEKRRRVTTAMSVNQNYVLPASRPTHPVWND
jgi:hypothetical protein